MQCLTDNGGGNFTIAAPQPTEYATCTYVIASPSEVTANAFALSVNDGSLVAVAIGTLWAIAAIIRIAISLLKPNEGASNEST